VSTVASGMGEAHAVGGALVSVSAHPRRDQSPIRSLIAIRSCRRSVLAVL